VCKEEVLSVPEKQCAPGAVCKEEVQSVPEKQCAPGAVCKEEVQSVPEKLCAPGAVCKEEVQCSSVPAPLGLVSYQAERTRSRKQKLLHFRLIKIAKNTLLEL
jgi:hypothetical protein